MGKREAEIADILRAHKLPHDDHAVDRILVHIEVAIDCVKASTKPLAKRDAERVVKTAQKLLTLASRHHLASREELRIVRRMKRLGDIARLQPTSPGPDIRWWLWPICQDLLEAWRELSFDPNTGKSKPDGLWIRGVPSPALQYLEACCKLADSNVNADAILYASEHAPPEISEEERASDYEEWGKTELAKKLFESDE